MAIDSNDAAVLTGVVSVNGNGSSFDFKAATINVPYNGAPEFLVKFDTNGAAEYALAFETTNNTSHRMLAAVFDSLDNLAIGGYYSGSIDFGVGPMTVTGNQVQAGVMGLFAPR